MGFWTGFAVGSLLSGEEESNSPTSNESNLGCFLIVAGAIVLFVIALILNYFGVLKEGINAALFLFYPSLFDIAHHLGEDSKILMMFVNLGMTMVIGVIAYGIFHKKIHDKSNGVSARFKYYSYFYKRNILYFYSNLLIDIIAPQSGAFSFAVKEVVIDG